MPGVSLGKSSITGTNMPTTMPTLKKKNSSMDFLNETENSTPILRLFSKGTIVDVEPADSKDQTILCFFFYFIIIILN